MTKIGKTPYTFKHFKTNFERDTKNDGFPSCP